MRQHRRLHWRAIDVPAEMPSLPIGIQNKVDGIIHRLNGEYKLGIPDLRPQDRRKIAAPDEGRSKRCVELLKYLCAREGYQINGIIRRYDLECRQIWSEWRCENL